MLCYAVIVALLPKSSRLILRWALYRYIYKKCWSAEFLDALHGLERSGDFQHHIRTCQTIPQSQFVVNVRKVEEYLVPDKPPRQRRSDGQGCKIS